VGHDRHEGTAGLDDRGRTSEQVAADRVVDQLDLADGVLPAVLLDFDEAVGAQVEHALLGADPARADHVRAGQTGELHADRADTAAGAVDHHRLSALEVPVVEQRLPRREPGLRERGGLDMVERLRLRCERAHFDRDVLGGPPVAVTVDEAIDLVADVHPGGAVAEGNHDAGPLVRRDDHSPVVAGSVGAEGPHQLGGGEAGGMHLDEGVADGGLGIRGGLVDKAVDALEALWLLTAQGLHWSLLVMSGDFRSSIP
jgi:hypothetical protein